MDPSATNTAKQSEPQGSAPQPAPKADPNANVRGMNNLLDALSKKGLIDQKNYNAVKLEAANSRKSIIQTLLDKKLVDEESAIRTLAEMRNIGFVDVDNVTIPTEVLNLIPKNIAEQRTAVPFEMISDRLKVAMKDPLDLQAIKFLESITKKRIEPYYATLSDIKRVIENKYGAQIGGEVSEALEEVHTEGELNLGKMSREVDQAASTAGDSSNNAPIIRIVSMILDYGIKNKASDIHIEPRDTIISVRFRVRGYLSEKLTIPIKLLSAVVTRIKILSNLKIDEHRIPQDGRFQVKGETGAVDIRVSIMPSIYGEKVVLRILEKSKGVLDLEKTGISGISYNRLKDAISKTQGIILVTGPTGSGKTQTLASCLKKLNTPEVNIITLEDPVEIRIDGVNQTQVNTEVGLTFANGLRSILRQDPDIVMVGEIRDSETAALAVQAALVGRLVLSTLHTNSSAGAFVRLIDMGVEPFLITSTVNVVMAQRLVRVLCDCKREVKATPEQLKELHAALDPLGEINLKHEDGKIKVHFDKETNDLTLYEPVGCPECNETGYGSRIGIFEALDMSETISKLVVERASISKIEKVAVEEGMIPLLQDGFIKVLDGITTIEEVLRVRNE